MKQYILIQHCKAKVFLLASPHKPYTIKCGQTVITIDVMMESWVVMLVYMNNTALISQWLRGYNNNVGSTDIDNFISKIKRDHPLHDIAYSLQNVPCIASDEADCEMRLDIYTHPIKLTLAQERELLNIVKSNNILDKQVQLIKWFDNYRAIYGIECRYKRDEQIQDFLLAELFCLIHGLDINNLQINTPVIMPAIKGLVVSTLWFGIWGWVFYHAASSDEFSVFNMLLCFVGLAMICIPLYAFFKNQ